MPAKIIWTYICSLLCLCSACDSKETILSPHRTQLTIHTVFPPFSLTAEKEGAYPYLILAVLDAKSHQEVVRQEMNLFNYTTPYKDLPYDKDGSIDLDIEWGQLELVAGDYLLLSWVDYRTHPKISFYNTSDLQRVTLTEWQAPGVKDAFAACSHLHLQGTQEQITKLMFYNPLATFRFLINSSSEKFLEKKVLLEHQGYYPIVYNILEGRCSSAIHQPQWSQKSFPQENEKVLLMEGVHFTDYNHPTTALFNLYIGNDKGHLLYETQPMKIRLEAGKVAEKVLEEKDFQDYTQNGIIDDEFSGDINIEI